MFYYSANIVQSHQNYLTTLEGDQCTVFRRVDHKLKGQYKKLGLALRFVERDNCGVASNSVNSSALLVVAALSCPLVLIDKTTISGREVSLLLNKGNISLVQFLTTRSLEAPIVRFNPCNRSANRVRCMPLSLPFTLIAVSYISLALNPPRMFLPITLA